MISKDRPDSNILELTVSAEGKQSNHHNKKCRSSGMVSLGGEGGAMILNNRCGFYGEGRECFPQEAMFGLRTEVG